MDESDDLVNETTDDLVDEGLEGEVQVEFLQLPKRDMPKEIKEVFEPISNAVTRLFANRAVFKDLYGTQESVDILNKTASGAFFLIGLMFRDDFIIAASRLTDPKSTRVSKTEERDNLTFKQLVHVVQLHCDDKELVARMVKQEKKIHEHCKNIRLRRNRVVAHLDLKAALKNGKSEPAPVVDIQEIDGFLSLVGTFLNEVVGYYNRSHREFNPVIGGPGFFLVNCLKRYQRLSEAEGRRLRESM